ncbi:MAG: hypothetical protein FJY85_26090, partial [Deltaproteobacteria bacterium]|nr:hypothetical protein [Deltaproteobacteria bacterium]
MGIRLIHGIPQNREEPENISFSGGREELPPEKWVDLRFPLECFGGYGACSDWSDVREIEIIFGRERDHAGADEIEVHIQGLNGEYREVPQGPRLTREGLANVLREDVARVTEFFETAQTREMPCSVPVRSKALSLYSPLNPALFVPPPHSYTVDTTEEIHDGIIMGQRIGHPVPWDAKPMEVQEWSHFLHRHHFTRELVKALAETGEDRHAEALDRIVMSWIRANPVPVDSNGGAGPSWETLSAAWRLREWLWIIGIGWAHRGFRRETKVEMLCSVWEHARSLMDHRGHPNNWIIVESAALALAGLCFPEFQESEEWV